LVRPEFGITGSHPAEGTVSDCKLIEGQYLRDILDQPRAIEDTLANLQTTKPLETLAARLHKGKFDSVVLTGMGSSFHALHPLQIELIQNGYSALRVETSELIHYWGALLSPRTLIIAVSQSGRSAEMVRLLQLNRRRAAILAVTNTADSPLARRSDAAILTRAGKEHSVSCKTYLCSLLALKLAGDVLCGKPAAHTRKHLRLALPAVSDYLASWKLHVESLAEKLAGVRHLFLVGRGASLAAVGTGALIIKESDQLPAEGMSSAAFRHGPFEMLGPEMYLLVFAGDRKTKALNERLYEDVRRQNTKAGLVAENAADSVFHLPPSPSGILPVLEILSVQMMTLALAALAGREAGKFRLVTKITTAE
jgi:glucosamine--fructose-6-phosphate aminotransferase (isomerizing)